MMIGMGRKFAVFAFWAGVAWTSVAPAQTTTSLTAAVRSGDLAAVEALLASGADVGQTAPDGSTPLHLAIRDGDGPLVDLLLAAGADPSAATRYGITPLGLAAGAGAAPLVTSLLAHGADPNDGARGGQTPLLSAAENGDPETVAALLEAGADVNAREAWRGQTALMWAAGRGNVAVIDRLLEAGADVHARSDGGFTALLFAVRENRIEAARALLARGAAVEDTTPDGTSALNVAILNAYYDLAVVLLEAGANPNASDPRGSALHIVAWLHKPGSTWDAAALSAEPETAPRPTGRVTALELARALLMHGADPNLRAAFEEQVFTMGLGTTMNPPGLMLGRHYLSYDGATPFYVAARNGDYRLLEVLAEFGADATIPSSTGVTPLMAAAGLDYYEGETPGPSVGVPEAERLAAVRLALELGNAIDARTDFGDYTMDGDAAFTLLTYPRNFKELSTLGVGDFRFDGMTALHGAVISNQPSIVEYLLAHGADPTATNELGWTPLMIADGIFLANAKKEFPIAAEILRAAIAARERTARN